VVIEEIDLKIQDCFFCALPTCWKSGWFEYCLYLSCMVNGFSIFYCFAILLFPEAERPGKILIKLLFFLPFRLPSPTFAANFKRAVNRVKNQRLIAGFIQ